MSNTFKQDRAAGLMAYLRTPKIQAYISDQVEESLLMVNEFDKLDILSQHNSATEHFMWSDDANGAAILCRRDATVVQEATFLFSGVLAQKSVMPYSSFREFTQATPWASSGHQHVVITLPGHEQHMQQLKRAIRNAHVMARLRYLEGQLKPLTDLVVDDEDAICASTPLGTPLALLVPGDVPLTLTQLQDPQGLVGQYINSRGMVILGDNEVDTYMATHLEKAGTYKLHGGNCGAFLRAGQFVRVEIMFRVVPAGKQFMMRTELKSVAIINDDIVAARAFAEADAQEEGIKRTISVSSAGPSGGAVEPQVRIKRAPRKLKDVSKDNLDEKTMGELPFAST